MDVVGLLDELTGAGDALPQGIALQLPDMVIGVRSNSPALLDILRDYFRHIIVDEDVVDDHRIEVVALEREPLQWDVDWQDWSRPAGKRGRKDAYVDVCEGQVQGRLIWKVRTGMVFLQSLNHRIAVGPCLANANQVINFINNQYMNDLQQQGWLICHAAAVAESGKITAMAGFSGGGKSTMMLHLMNHAQFNYVTNDRMFIKPVDGHVQARGVPKLPRVNPGTIIHNARLRSMLAADEIAAFEAMPQQELWDLEQKYDVDVGQVYGADRFDDAAPLDRFIVLNWSRDSQQPTKVSAVEIAHRPELLDAIMKSSGPFYQYADGSFYDDQHGLTRQQYIAVLEQVQVLEVTGGVSFDVLEQACLTGAFEQ